jgi:LPXTG-motif cell wall-anchored protein
MSARLSNGMFLFLSVLVLIIVPLSHTALQAQQTEGPFPYYDPRYTNDTVENQRQKPSGLSELPATGSDLPLLALIGVFSLIGAAGLRRASISQM